MAIAPVATSAKGNPFLNTDGFNIVVYRASSGWTFGRVGKVLQKPEEAKGVMVCR